jgi:hypothetical protein
MVARQAAKILAIELLVPGGTLLVLSILLARSRVPGIPKGLVRFSSFMARTRRRGNPDDLVAYWGFRRLR